ncbi:coiled-coil-helix-coiled-coil-helix domain containing 3b isoform X5 [Xyrauchen texanus]|uniref:coiled-coil-helix-coiled-coil-helix domain containing 3b isoform X5 n=1 Tax=Xyrauchen texanus TaxID=154827 RepID=UPI002241904A|nr:coiled-coil-helix-coiled-coil-helix domain containing 3b isoform X5 [Xyrauchen texanus]
MGGSSSSRHVAFDPDNEEGVSFVKGIRLSERVIDRMRESPSVVRLQTSTKLSPSTPPVAPHVEHSPPGEHHVPVMPHPPSYASALVPPPLSEPITPLVPLIPVTEESPAPPPTVQSAPLPAQPVGLLTPQLVSIPVTLPSLVEESTVPPSPSTSAVELSSKTPSMVEMDPSSIEEPPAPHLPLVEEPVIPPFLNPVGSLSPPPQTQTKVNEEELRTQIKEELQKLLKVEIKMTELQIQQQLEEEKVKAKAQAEAAARLQIQKEVQKVLEEEKVSYQHTLADAIRREQLNIQDDHLIAQYYWMDRKAQKLEEKQKDLEKQDGLFRDQVAKLQEKAAQFTKVTSENYKKGFEDTHNRFRRYQIKPVCSDLQSQILKCYAENKGQTLTCSNIASLYIQCVDRAKQDTKLSTGG